MAKAHVWIGAREVNCYKMSLIASNFFLYDHFGTFQDTLRSER
jgi:hypothetical protein